MQNKVDPDKDWFVLLLYRQELQAVVHLARLGAWLGPGPVQVEALDGALERNWLHVEADRVAGESAAVAAEIGG